MSGKNFEKCNLKIALNVLFLKNGYRGKHCRQKLCELLAKKKTDVCKEKDIIKWGVILIIQKI